MTMTKVVFAVEITFQKNQLKNKQILRQFFDRKVTFQTFSFKTDAKDY